MGVFSFWNECVGAEGSDPKPLPWDSAGLTLQRAMGARYASLPAKGKILFIWQRPHLAEPVANTTIAQTATTHVGLNPEPCCDATIQPLHSSQENMSELERIIFQEGLML